VVLPTRTPDAIGKIDFFVERIGHFLSQLVFTSPRFQALCDVKL
jgi:hypothetical protein